MMDDQRTEINFGCPYSIEERYNFVITGLYNVFEMLDGDGEVTGYRGTRKYFGVTGVYDNYKDALEAAFTTFGHLKETDNDTGTTD